MCTISLVPSPDSPNGFILTSNRDEAVSRKTIPPKYSKFQSVKAYYPKDEQAGGTWIGVSESNRCVCLMNGAEEPHVRKANYRKSRGVVVKEFLAGNDLTDLLENYQLENIEPFTMIIVDWSNGLLFYEFLWNEEQRKVNRLKLGSYIWSSSPLYTEGMKDLRKKWFKDLKQSKGFSPDNLLDFHQNAGEGNPESDLVIDRGFLKTQSITQVFNSKDSLRFWYKDLKKNKVIEEYVQFNA